MFTARRSRLGLALTAITAAALLTGCAQGNPLDTGEDSSDVIIIGSQGSGESEILAQLYGQVLANAGYSIEYKTSIGSREAFITALQTGAVDIVPDYAGNLLFNFDVETDATTIEEIEAALPDVLAEEGLSVAAASPAEDADALVVTPEFSRENDVTSIGDLAKLEGDFTLGANTEFESRYYGREGLETVYGVTGWTFKAIDDYGGAGTLKDLLDGNIQVADIYTTTPSIGENDLVVLEDPENLIPAQNLIPLLNNDTYTDEIAALLNGISEKLTTEGLLDLNRQYAGEDKPTAATVATEWLTANGFLS